jgi:hypothetical protein
MSGHRIHLVVLFHRGRALGATFALAFAHRGQTLHTTLALAFAHRGHALHTTRPTLALATLHTARAAFPLAAFHPTGAAGSTFPLSVAFALALAVAHWGHAFESTLALAFTLGATLALPFPLRWAALGRGSECHRDEHGETGRHEGQKGATNHDLAP